MNMKSKFSKLFAGGFSLLAVAGVTTLIVGCNTTQPPKTSADTAAVSEAPLGKGGAELWSENCARCHNIRSPSTFSDTEWDVAMHHMRVRANLTADESKKILEFLKSAN